MGPRAIAVIAALGAATLLSSSGVLVRSMHTTDGLQIALFRASALLVVVVAIYLRRHGARVVHELRRSGRWPLIAGPLQGAASLSFVMALTHTTVASAMVMLSATPLFAALIGWAALRERADAVTIIAAVVCAAGIAVVMTAGVGGGTLAGDLFALANSVVYAAFIVVLRRKRDVDMLPALVVGGACVAGTCWLLAPSIDLGAHDILLCVVWGGIVQGTALSLLVFAARHLVAAELCLLTLLEFVLGPAWVWLLFSETPAPMVVGGGALIVATVVYWSALEWLRYRRRAGA